jgi:hypothetical protein
MNSTFRRLVGVSAAAVVIAGSALVAAPAAQADGSYYGEWTLTTWKLGKERIDCPGSLPLPPPAPTIECKGGETLTLKPGYRYETTIPAFEGSFGTGYFATLKFPGAKAKTIVFDSDDAKDDPRAYQMKLIGMSSGTANKMVIFLAVGSGPVIKMIFRRLGK